MSQSVFCGILFSLYKSFSNRGHLRSRLTFIFDINTFGSTYFYESRIKTHYLNNFETLLNDLTPPIDDILVLYTDFFLTT